MIAQWLSAYQPKNSDETNAALREIMQEIALAGLYRANFFKEAAFYGGTALRIFHGLDRFSEDLDFSLLAKNPAFQIDAYFPAIAQEFQAWGMKVGIVQKQKQAFSAIESAFLKSETAWSELVLQDTVLPLNLTTKPVVKIKLEIDTLPPLGFTTEQQLLLRPFSCYIHCFSLPDLFAGKMHALLFRQWQQRVKGRDWYDFEWYVQRATPLHLAHFQSRAFESGHLSAQPITPEAFVQLLHDKIERVDFHQAKADIIRFIPKPEKIDIWSSAYFHALVNRMVFN